MPWMIKFSLEYVENVWGLLLLQPQMHINVVSPVWGQYGSNLGSLWPLSGDIKYWRVVSRYRGFKPGTLGSHAQTLTTAPLPPLGRQLTFVKNFATLDSPLTCLLKKKVPFCRHETQQQSFNILKWAVTEVPVLSFPDYKLPFTLCTDASSLGFVLIQGNTRKHKQQ